VSASGFSDWRARPASATAERRAELIEWIRVIFADADPTYGYRRVHAELARAGAHCGPEMVGR
jgi:putative transposase